MRYIFENYCDPEKTDNFDFMLHPGFIIMKIRSKQSVLESKTLNRLKIIMLCRGCEHGWSGWREQTRVDRYQGMVNGKETFKRRNPVKNIKLDASTMFQIKILKQSLQELSV